MHTEDEGSCRGFHDGKGVAAEPIEIQDPLDPESRVTVGWLCPVCRQDRPGPKSDGWDFEDMTHATYFIVEDGVERQVSAEEHERWMGEGR